MTDPIGSPPVRYARLRSGGVWLSDVRLDGLEVQPNGDIVLGRLPLVAPASLNPASPIEPSGIAVGSDCSLFVAEVPAGRIVRVRLDCGAAPPGTPDRAVEAVPTRAICVGPHGWLLVADAHGEQVLVFSHELELRDRWLLPGVHPTAVAFDGEGVVVLDAVAGTLTRVAAGGSRDDAFAARLELPIDCEPRGLASDGAGSIYVGCAAGVIAYTRAGDRVGPAFADGVQSRALAVGGNVLYVANENTGDIDLYSLPSGSPLGNVVGFRGPVAGLAVDTHGSVYIKTGGEDTFVTARALGAHRRQGTLEVAALDAGLEASWRRAAVRALVPDACDARLETFHHGKDPAAAPVWTTAAALDAPLKAARYVWLRVALESRDPLVTPRLLQVQAETSGESYIEHLPAVYSRDPEKSQFLESFLDLARSVLGDLETDIEELPRLVDPVIAPAEHLAWLASWQGFDVPARIAGPRDAETLRAILARLSSLNARRGTISGLRDFIEIETGVHPHVIECFRARSVWVLGSASALGFDTGLPRVSLEPAVIDQSALDGAALGPEEGLGRALFEDTAHRFSVLVPVAEAASEVEQRAVRRAVDELKPAHTDGHVCFIGPSLRVGIQARVGVDSIVADGPAPTALDQGDALDRGARLAPDPVTASGAVERRARVGIDTRLG